MKMGIERALKAAFGPALKEVIQVGGSPDADPGATVDAIDIHLNMLRGAIHSYGGSVEVASVAGGVAHLKYVGPKPIGYGVAAAVKERFKDLKEVVMMEGETGQPIQF
jgi:NFU1 iron-sulfur cluster scaffold homolog, mitochondrial